jgi:anti-sigma regulatory factor (Ser/Thr protein kinase)
MTDLSFELEPRLNAGQQARQVLRERIGEQLVDGKIDDLMTIMTELVNNAVIHGSGRTIDVRITLDGDSSVGGKVEDQGDGPQVIRELPEPVRDGGLGLRIVDALADRWGFYPGTNTVWFEIGEAAGLRE